MTIKKFQGKTEAEAVEKARAEFGAEAVIMNVKEIKPRGFFKSFKSSTFEVTAAVDEKESHASSVALLMALSLVSTALYLHRGSMTIGDALPYLPGALAGSAAGALLMPKISTKWLRRIFGLLMIYGGIRMVTG